MSRSIVTGIDVGTSSIKVIVVDADSHNEHSLPRVVATGISESKGIRHGYVTDIKEASQSISKAIKMAEEKASQKIRKASVGMNGIGISSVIINSLLMTSRADAEITDLDIKKITEQAEKDIPHGSIVNRRIVYSIPLQYKIDGVATLGNPIGMIGNKLELTSLFITCLEHHVHNSIQAINEAGIAVEDIMVSPITTGFFSLSKTQKVAGCGLVTIGAETVSLVVFENNVPTSLEVFQIGSDQITHDLALGLKISIEEAEQIKIGAITGNTYPRKKIEEIISARVEDIFEQVDKHLRRINRSGLLPAGIIITGGGSQISGIENIAKNVLKLPTKISNTSTMTGVSSSKDSVWSTAYGLAVWGLFADDGKNINDSMYVFRKAMGGIVSWFKQFLP